MSSRKLLSGADDRASADTGDLGTLRDVARLLARVMDDPDLFEYVRWSRLSPSDVLDYCLKPWGGEVDHGELRVLLARYGKREDWAGKAKGELRALKRAARLLPPEVRV